jgi:hypothetical protein
MAFRKGMADIEWADGKEDAIPETNMEIDDVNQGEHHNDNGSSHHSEDAVHARALANDKSRSDNGPKRRRLNLYISVPRKGFAT